MVLKDALLRSGAAFNWTTEGHTVRHPARGALLRDVRRCLGEHRLHLERGQDHDTTGDSKTYAGLLRTALDGSLLPAKLLVLRHYQPGPRPVRSWGE